MFKAAEDQVMIRTDLHIHSTFSDGLLGVADIVARAKEADVTFMSLTDHDTMAGTMECMRLARDAGIEFVSGVEVSSQYEGIEVHILGYGVLIKEFGKLDASLERNRRARRFQTEKILERYRGARILEMEYEELAAFAATFGREPNCMDILLARMERGKVSFTKAWDELFNLEGLAGDGFYREMLLSPNEAVKAIVRAGGVAILAHPAETYARLGRSKEKMDMLISSLALDRLDGLEIFHPGNEKTSEIEMSLESWLKDFCLIASAGSNNHGIAGYRSPIGSFCLSEEQIDAFYQLVEMRQKAHLAVFCTREE